MRKVLLFLFWFLSIVQAGASPAWTRDTTIYRIRNFDETQLQELRKSERYQYEEEEIKREAPGFWELLKDWIAELLKEYGYEHDPEHVEWFSQAFVWTLVGIALIIALVFLARNRQFGQFFHRRDQILDEAVEFLSYTGSNSNLEEELAQAERNQNYSLALRLLYIRCLRILEDAMLINYKKDKTNSEYLEELRMKLQYPYVEHLTYWFERVHYGEYQIDEAHYEECKALFTQMRQTLKGGKGDE